MTRKQPLRMLVAVLRDSVRVFQRTQASFLAAAVAYYAFISLVPLIALAAVLAATIAGRDLVAQLLAETGAVFTPETQQVLVEALTTAPERTGISVVAVGLTFWGALRVFRGLDTAFSRLYRTYEGKTALGTIKNAIIVIGAIAVGIALLTGVGVVVSRLPVVSTASGSLVLVVALAVVLFPVYVVFPDAPITPWEAVPGAVVAATGWTLLWSLFQVYVGLAGTVSIYGPLGGVLLLITFLYFAASILLAGATVNVVLVDRQAQ